MKKVILAFLALAIALPTVLWAIKAGGSYYVHPQTLYLRKYSSNTAAKVDPPLERGDKVTVLRVKRFWAKIRGRRRRDGRTVKGWCIARFLSTRPVEREYAAAGNVGRVRDAKSTQFMATAGSRAIGNLAWMAVKTGKPTKRDADIVDKITEMKLNPKAVDWLMRTGKLGTYMEVE